MIYGYSVAGLDVGWPATL